MWDQIKAALGYTVHVKWEGQNYIHYAWTRKEAYEWMKCYPLPAYVWITHSFGSYVSAIRGKMGDI